MTPTELHKEAIIPAYGLLPAKMNSPEASLMLLAIPLQESELKARRQLITVVINGKKTLVPKGPAVSFWQFEQGDPKSRAGVWGILNHFKVGPMARDICTALGVVPTPPKVWEAMQTNDVLAACMARLLLYSSPKALPRIGDIQGAWNTYEGIWRPGKPHPEKWPAHYATARAALGV